MHIPKHFARSQELPQKHAGVTFLLYSLGIALFCALYAESMYEVAGLERTGIAAGFFFGGITVGAIIRFCMFFLTVFIVLTLLSRKPEIATWILEKRHLLAVVLLFILICLEIHGSSIALWGNTFGEGTFEGTLFGMPRWVRVDEWKVFTPFSFSQVQTGNMAISDVIRGGNTDVTMVYAQPSWSLATIYRPFLWGYLFLGAAKGLSFFWCSRAILLVLVTFDCMLLVSNGNKKLSAYAAILVGFAPIVEWWFAVNGTADLFIFGQGLVLALHHLLRAQSTWKRWAWAVLLSWLLGCYALIIYPAWQVPFVYVFGAIGIWDFWCWIHAEGVKVKERILTILPPLLFAVALVSVGVGLSLYNARDALAAESNTVYPGHRFFTGGELRTYLPYTTIPLLSSLWADSFPGNVCESSAFASLFPLGIALSVIVLVRVRIKQRRIDPCILLALCVYALFFCYGLLGFPPVLAKATLLSNTHPGRLLLPMGYLDVLLLVRSFALMDDLKKSGDATERHSSLRASLVVGCVDIVLVALCWVLVAHHFVPEVASLKALGVLAVASILLLVPVLLPSSFFDASRCDRSAWLAASALVVFVAGVCANPLQHGADALLKSSTMHELQAYAQKDPNALWVTDDSVMGQACVAYGIPAITSVNVYPNLERWRAIDPTGEYEDYYNRYAHITLTLGDELAFETPWPDICATTLTPEDVPAFGATYWLSSQKLDAWNTEAVRFEQVDTVGALTLYRVVSTTE